MLSQLHAFLLRLSINPARHLAALVVGAALCGLPAARAQTVDFESPVDLSTYTVHRSNAASVSVTQTTGSGAGNPASSGLTMLSTSTGSGTALLLRPDVTGAANFNQWQVSLLINLRETDDHASGEKKTESRFGFAATKNLPSDVTKLHEFFHKTNHSISVQVKADHTVGSLDKIRRLEFQLTNYNGSDTNYGKVTLNNSDTIDHWIRVTLTVTRAGATTFNATFLAESLGPDGTSAPVQLATHTQAGLVNTNLASAATIYTGFTLNGDKQADTRLYADDHVTTFSNLPPATPTALAATAINSNGFTANWQAGAGLPGAGYVLEATTAADNFLSGNYLTATGGTSPSGIVLNGAGTVSQVFTGLDPTTAYVYRVKATNSAGESAVSNVVSVSTIAGNAAPTLDPIANQPPVRPTDGARTIMLTGITAGGEAGQTVTLTATSSNPAILPHPTIDYTAGATTATLTYDPADGGTGAVTITVTANDGQPQNNTLVRNFVVPVQFPVPLLGFENDNDVLSLLHVPINGSLTREDSVGTGAPAGGGLTFQRTGPTGTETGAAVWRVQSYSGVTSTNLSSSIFLNPREVDDAAPNKDKIEIGIGFVGTTTVNSGKPQEFLRKTNPGLSVKLNVEHDPSDVSKAHKLEAEVSSWDGFQETKGAKLTLLNQATAINHWLKLVFDAVKTGPETYQLTYRVEDWGADGSALVGVLMTGDPIDVTNSAIAEDPEIWSGFSLNTEKNGVAKAYLDRWETTVGENPPAVPVAQNAVQVTSGSFLAKWTPGAVVFSTDYVVEAVAGTIATANFSPGNFLTTAGTTSASGIVVNGSAARSVRIAGLNASSSYVYRVRGLNPHGQSAPSNVIVVTTLAPGANSLPTLDPIANPPALNINAAEQSLVLTGISAGGETTQTATVSAESSNPALIPDPFVNYNDPDETGTLFFTPNAGETGSATITVTVSDGLAETQRTFVVTVAEPQTLIAFNDATALSRIDLTNYLGATFDFGAAAGVGSPAGGGAIYTRTGSLESVSVGFRPTAYDARVVPHFTASMFINVREIVNLTSGKDKAELRFGFAGENLPNTNNPKDTLNKTHPALGISFKAEHEFNKPDKDRKVEIECFSFDGTTESKGGKSTASSVPATANWLKVTLYVMRGGQDQYYVVYDVADWGVNGTAWQAQVLTGGPFLATNAPFFADASVYAGFTLTSEKTSTKNIYLDNYEVIVNTTAPDAPLPLAPANVRAKEFTAQWAPSLLGLAPDGYVLDVTTQANNFAPGTFINASGQGGQAAGIVIGNAFTTTRTITGLTPNQNYVYRIRALRNGEPSAIIGRTFVTTLATDLAFWRETYFADALNDPSISGLTADPDKDGVNNLLEYALGSHPRDAASTGRPTVDASGTYLRLTFLRRLNAPDIVYIPESSGDLNLGFDDDVTEIGASAPDAEGLQIVVVEDNVPIDEAFARFMRVRVEALP